MQLLIFPGIWLLVTAGACAVRLDATLAGLLSFVAGAATYLLRGSKAIERCPTIAKRTASLIGILVVSVLLTRSYYWITWDPIGTTDDGWGKVPGGIFQDVVQEWPEVPSALGFVVSVRKTSSGLLSVDVPASYFVFVHPLQQQDSNESLIFRYYATGGFNAPPQVSWESESRLIITVGVRDILTVTKQRNEIDGVRITYSLGRPAYNSEVAFWQRPLF